MSKWMTEAEVASVCKDGLEKRETRTSSCPEISLRGVRGGFPVRFPVKRVGFELIP